MNKSERNAAIETIKNGRELDAYAWPGGYPIVYTTHDGEEVCPSCASGLVRGYIEDMAVGDRPHFPIVSGDTHLEGPPVNCDQCTQDVYSAYGDPDEAEEPCPLCGAMVKPYSVEHTTADCDAHLTYIDREAISTAERRHWDWYYRHMWPAPIIEGKSGYLSCHVLIGA
jgi:hypothetical protein